MRMMPAGRRNTEPTLETAECAPVAGVLPIVVSRSPPGVVPTMDRDGAVLAAPVSAVRGCVLGVVSAPVPSAAVEVVPLDPSMPLLAAPLPPAPAAALTPLPPATTPTAEPPAGTPRGDTVAPPRDLGVEAAPMSGGEAYDRGETAVERP